MPAATSSACRTPSCVTASTVVPPAVFTAITPGSRIDAHRRPLSSHTSSPATAASELPCSCDSRTAPTARGPNRPESDALGHRRAAAPGDLQRTVTATEHDRPAQRHRVGDRRAVSEHGGLFGDPADQPPIGHRQQVVYPMRLQLVAFSGTCAAARGCDLTAREGVPIQRCDRAVSAARRRSPRLDHVPR